MYDMFYAWLLGLSGRGVSHQQKCGGRLKVRSILAEGMGGGGVRVRRKTREKGEDRVNTCGFKQNFTFISLSVYLFFFLRFIGSRKMVLLPITICCHC